nr:zinc-ribbon domain-containing protein [Akkermansiaceae bacterium]
MKTTCPNCATHLELDEETLAGLAGQETFECPGCRFAVRVPAAPPPPPVMAPARPAPRLLVAAPGAARMPTPLQARPPWRPQQLTRPKQPRQPRPAASQARRLGFRLWILGTALIGVLGGLGFILASKIKGDRYDKREQIRNEIIRNKFFQTLIASGATTEQTLQSEVAAISSDGDGFVGVSSRKLPWKEAWQMAQACGARVVDTSRTPGRNAADVTGFLAGCFSELQGETVWLAVDGLPRITDLPDLLPVSTLDRPRRLLLRWIPGAPTTPADIEGFSLIPAGNFQMGDQSNPPVGDRNELPV